MRKSTYLDLRRSHGWPKPEELEPYFLGPPGQRWAFENGNDNAGLAAEGVDGTADLDPNDGRIDVDLDMGSSLSGRAAHLFRMGRRIEGDVQLQGKLGTLARMGAQQARHAVAGWVVHPIWDGLE